MYVCVCVCVWEGGGEGGWGGGKCIVQFMELLLTVINISQCAGTPNNALLYVATQ